MVERMRQTAGMRLKWWMGGWHRGRADGVVLLLPLLVGQRAVGRAVLVLQPVVSTG